MMRESSVAATATNEMDLMPLYMSLIAGLSTCLGAVWVLFKKRPTGKASVDSVIHPSTMCFSLALAGSVMVTVSVVSIIPECLREQATIDDSTFHLIPLLSMKFFYRLSFHMIGYFLYFILSKFVFPEPNEILGLAPGQQHHEDVETQELIRTTSSDSSKDTAKARNRRLDSRPTGSLNVDEEEFEESSTGKDKEKVDFFRSLSRYSSGEDLQTSESKRAWRVAMLLFISLSVHNFPEGLAVAASAMNSPELGLKVTIGIMVHNIPEGVSIAVPCIAARPDNPWLAFWLSALSGLAEPLGAFVALFVLRKIDHGPGELEPLIFNMENVLAFVAGIMIMVAVAELFPEALRHTKDGKTPFVVGILCGVVLMVATELYLA